jgi:para-nitrobenzyl esterase
MKPSHPGRAVLTTLVSDANFDADQQALAASMRAAWASFAAKGAPSTPSLVWPAFTPGQRVMSLVPPQPQVWAGFSGAHHCSFWAAG